MGPVLSAALAHTPRYSCATRVWFGQGCFRSEGRVVWCACGCDSLGSLPRIYVSYAAGEPKVLSAALASSRCGAGTRHKPAKLLYITSLVSLGGGWGTQYMQSKAESSAWELLCQRSFKGTSPGVKLRPIAVARFNEWLHRPCATLVTRI